MFSMLMSFINARVDVANEEGQTLVEYGLILALVSITVIGVLGLLAGGIGGVFTEITDAL